MFLWEYFLRIMDIFFSELFDYTYLKRIYLENKHLKNKTKELSLILSFNHNSRVYKTQDM